MPNVVKSLPDLASKAKYDFAPDGMKEAALARKWNPRMKYHAWVYVAPDIKQCVRCTVLKQVLYSNGPRRRHVIGYVFQVPGYPSCYRRNTPRCKPIGMRADLGIRD